MESTAREKALIDEVPTALDKYRIERMAPAPAGLPPGVESLDEDWCIVRNHDDELMAIYPTLEAARGALLVSELSGRIAQAR